MKINVFLDIETVPGDTSFIPIDISVKAKNILDPKKLEAKKGEAYKSAINKAALWWPTGRIFCIGLQKGAHPETLIDWNEKLLLQRFSEWFGTNAPYDEYQLITFNGMEFDIPYLLGRMSIHHIPWPYPLTNHQFAKPWENNLHVDLYQILTRGGRFKMFDGGTTLDAWAAYYGLNVIDHSGVRGDFVPNGWQMVMDGELDPASYTETVAAHCIADIAKLRLLYCKVKEYFIKPERIFQRE